jgi:hypothetical protein
MRKRATAIKSSEGTLCSICRGRVWGCRQQRCNS